MFKNEFGIKDSHTNADYSNITWNGQNCESKSETVIKFHIQHLFFENEIAILTKDFFDKTYQPYYEQLPTLSNFPTNVVVHEDGLIQFRVLFKSNNQDYYLTYLLKKDNIYYRPTYEEKQLMLIINKIYLKNTIDVYKQFDYADVAVVRNITIKKQTDKNEILSLLTPEHMSCYEALGTETPSGGCSCCAGSRLDYIPRDMYIMNTGTYYKHENKSQNFRFTFEDLNYIKSVNLTRLIGYNNNTHFDEHDDTFLKCMGDFLENGIIFNFTKETITLNMGSFFTYLFSSGFGDNTNIRFGRGKYFVNEANPYSDEKFYYPNWVTDDTIWTHMTKSNRWDHDCTHAIDLSNNTYAIRLFQIYDYFKDVFDNILSKGKRDYTKILVKHHQIEPLSDIYDDFEKYVNSEEFIKIKSELLLLVFSLKLEDFVDLEITPEFKKYYDFYNKKIINDSPHVFIKENNYPSKKEYILSTIVDNIYIEHSYDNDITPLIKISKTWPNKELVILSSEENNYQKTFYKSVYFSNKVVDYHKTNKHFEEIKSQHNNNKLQMITIPKKQTSRFSFEKQIILDNMVQKIEQSY